MQSGRYGRRQVEQRGGRGLPAALGAAQHYAFWGWLRISVSHFACAVIHVINWYCMLRPSVPLSCLRVALIYPAVHVRYTAKSCASGSSLCRRTVKTAYWIALNAKRLAVRHPFAPTVQRCAQAGRGGAVSNRVGGFEFRHRHETPSVTDHFRAALSHAQRPVDTLRSTLVISLHLPPLNLIQRIVA